MPEWLTINNKADQRAINICKKHEINISAHKGQQVQISDFDKFDIIYAMDQANYNDLMYKIKKESHKNKIKLILSENLGINKISIPDPYYGNPEDFKNVYNLLDETCTIITEKLLQKASE